MLIVCFLIGVAARTPAGRALEERIEKSFFERMPGYALFRSLTQRLAGKNDEENVWKPALTEIEEALVPAFIIEELEDGRFTGFRALGAHALRGSRLYSHAGTGASAGSPFTEALKSVSRWGSIGTDCFSLHAGVVSGSSHSGVHECNARRACRKRSGSHFGATSV